MKATAKERFVVATKDGCVCGRGSTLEDAILETLRCDNFTVEELVAGDNATQSRVPAEAIAAAIEAVDGPAAREARSERMVTVQSDRERSADRGDYIDVDD